MMSAYDIADDVHVAWVPQGMGNNQGPGTGGDSLFDEVWIDVAGLHFDINKNRDQPVLEDRGQGAGKGHRRRDHLIPSFKMAFQVRGHQGSNGKQVGRRA